MKLEDQVISLDNAKKLKELGVKQDSLFYRCLQINGSEDRWINFGNDLHEYNEIYSAFTAAELLEILPEFIRNYNLIINKESESYYVFYEEQDVDLYTANSKFLIFNDKNLSNSLAKTLIFLIENKLIEVK